MQDASGPLQTEAPKPGKIEGWIILDRRMLKVENRDFDQAAISTQTLCSKHEQRYQG